LIVSELQKGGNEVEFAADALTALVYLRGKRKFDVVVVDSPVSKIFGEDAVPQDFEVLQEATKNSIVIVVSGSLTDERRQQVKKWGAAEVFAKPFSLRRFHRHIDQLLAHTGI